jgi:hypothetical protein
MSLMAKIPAVLLFCALAGLSLYLALKAAGDERLSASWATLAGMFCAMVFTGCAIALGALA